MKISLRLKKIFSLAQSYHDYDVVYDTCCDHGYLGMLFLDDKKFDHVVFVDVIDSITKRLEEKLKKIQSGFEAQKKWSVVTCDAGLIDIDINKRNLVCICGVGGRVAISIVDNILNRHQELSSSHASQVDFIISAHFCEDDVRDFLRSKNYRLYEESFIFENSQGYEILYVGVDGENEISLSSKRQLSEYNDQSFQKFLKKKEEHVEYLKKYWPSKLSRIDKIEK